VTTPARGLPDPFVLELDYSKAPILARLPRGRHGLPRDFVEQNHRYRLLGAAIDAAAERGYAAMTVADITRHAAVSRRAFYQHYRDKEDCFLAAYDVTVEWLFESVTATIDPGDSWADALAAAVERVLDLLAADSRLARLCAVEVFLAGQAAVRRHEELIERLVASLRRGRAEHGNGEILPAQMEEALLGGAISLVARYVHAGRTEQLRELTPVLTELLLSPYVGPGDSRRVLAATP
jgi:AcrR family transcriptional regulator